MAFINSDSSIRSSHVGVEVLLIASNFPPVRGGSAVVYANLARCAAGRIMVLATRLSYLDGKPLTGYLNYDRHATFPIVRLALLRTIMTPPRNLLHKVLFFSQDLLLRCRVAYSILRLLVRQRPRTVCIGELLSSSWLIHLLGYVPGLRVLVYVHGEEITTDDPNDPGRRRCRRALAAAHAIVVVSAFSQAAVLSLLGPAANSKIRLIENGVDAARFVPGPKRPELMERFGLNNCFVFVSVCRLVEKKGIDQALRAFARIADVNCRFLIIGKGPYEEVLRMLALELCIAERVVFGGQVPESDLIDHYRLGDVFVMPNRALPNGDTEGFGLVFLEANGCGLPVIAGRAGGSTNAVRNGVNGLVVDGTSVSAIAAAMQQLKQSKTMRARLRQAGLELAAQADWAEKTQDFLVFAAGMTLPPEMPSF